MYLTGDTIETDIGMGEFSDSFSVFEFLSTARFVI